MNKEAMNGKLLKALAGVGTAGAIGGSFYGGSKYGSKKGKKELAGKFNTYNKQENKLIGSAAYRKGAQDAYNYLNKKASEEQLVGYTFDKEAGAKDAIAKLLIKAKLKKAPLTKMEKIVVKLKDGGKKAKELGIKGKDKAVDTFNRTADSRAKAIKFGKDTATTTGKSFKNLGGDIKSIAKAKMYNGPLKEEILAKARKDAFGNMRNSKAALGILGGGSLAGAYGAGRSSKRG